MEARQSIKIFAATKCTKRDKRHIVGHVVLLLSRWEGTHIFVHMHPEKPLFWDEAVLSFCSLTVRLGNGEGDAIRFVAVNFDCAVDMGEDCKSSS